MSEGSSKQVKLLFSSGDLELYWVNYRRVNKCTSLISVGFVLRE